MPDQMPGGVGPRPLDFGELSRESWRELFDELADGRIAGLERLYDVASHRLFGLALWRTGSRDDACDVVQDTLVRVAEQRHRLRNVRDPRSWLLAVTHRLAVDVVRRRVRSRAEPLEDHPYLAAAGEDADRLVDAERMSCLLAALPPAQREAIYLRHFADCTFAEIGTIVGVPTFTAASRYRLGIRALRRLVEESS